MTIHPELGYFDEGLDLTEKAVYAPAARAFGKARVLNPVAFRSRIFAELEDEKIWTRSWICVGTADQIPRTGDLLPYTAGNHGLHVQRERGGRFVGRFNMAQHGGCRTIPLQCQTGTKTKCSFTSCGYSRDRDVISADELGDDTPEMRQYLGYRPERLFPVKVEAWGPLLFVNIDQEAPPLAEHLGDVENEIGALLMADRKDCGGFWLEHAANWKLLAGAMMDGAGAFVDDLGKPSTAKHRVLAKADGADAAFCWLYPNLFIAVTPDHVVSAVLQPTSVTDTLVRVRMAMRKPVRKKAVEALEARWRDGITDVAGRAVERQEMLGEWATPARPKTKIEDLPVEKSRPAHGFQKYLVGQLLAEHDYVWANPLYANVTR